MTDVTPPTSWDCRSLVQLSPVPTQGECGSCWAYVVADMLADRLAIATRYAAPHLSTETIKSCAMAATRDRLRGELSGTDAWTKYLGDCQTGGFIAAGCWFAENYGVPLDTCVGTPSDTSNHGIDSPCKDASGCDPLYSFEIGSTRIITHGPRDQVYTLDEGECIPPCTLPASVISANVLRMQRDIMANGPLAIGYISHMDLRADNFSDTTYDDGVYRVNLSSGVDAGHAVLIVGWGVADGGTPYWTIRNSWGADWNGDGHWRHLRGSNDSGVESSAVSALPRLAGASQAYTGPAHFAATWDDTDAGRFVVRNSKTLIIVGAMLVLAAMLAISMRRR